MESCSGRSKQNRCSNSKVAGRRCIVRVRVAGVSIGKGWWGGGLPRVSRRRKKKKKRKEKSLLS
uniref:Putative ovule protein n=1 Tax=Solanum chacoense TaxID=4108 RepID=A0A0V0IPM8_SOLCH